MVYHRVMSVFINGLGYAKKHTPLGKGTPWIVTSSFAVLGSVATIVGYRRNVSLMTACKYGSWQQDYGRSEQQKRGSQRESWQT